MYEQNLRGENRQLSKGNQLKWLQDDIWYKADYTGYKGLTEYVVSGLLKESDLEADEYVTYETEEIRYGYQQFRGCKSRNFLPKTFCDDFDEQLDIAEKLYGQQVKFAFTEKTLTNLLDRETV